MTRDVIIDAARRLFEAKGYDETSMEDIAQAAGCSRRTPYNHFENKRNLWYAVVHDDNLKFLELLNRAAADERENGLESYRAIAHAGFKFMAEHPEVDRRLSEFQVHSYRERYVPDLQHDYARRCTEINDEIADLVSRAIHTAQNEGLVRSDRTSFELLVFSAAVMTGASNLAQFQLSQGKGGDVEELFERGWRFVLRILTEGEKKPGGGRRRRAKPAPKKKLVAKKKATKRKR